MDKIIEKISSYHIFNYLVPGYLFLIISGQIMEKNLIIDSLIYSFFEAYFIGIIISRISSLVIEKIIVKIWKLKKEPYDKYIEANKKDDKLEILNQDCNMYRSLCTLMLIELALKIMVMFEISSLINKDILILVMFTLLTILFAFSFVKQNRFISSRVKRISKKNRFQKDTLIVKCLLLCNFLRKRGTINELWNI